jgi:hypothetical protein
VYARFRRWRVSGALRRAHDALRARVRVTEDRAADASAAVVDTTGLVLLAVVHAADLHQGYTDAFARWLRETRGSRLEVVRHPERQLWRYGLGGEAQAPVPRSPEALGRGAHVRLAKEWPS